VQNRNRSEPRPARCDSRTVLVRLTTTNIVSAGAWQSGTMVSPEALTFSFVYLLHRSAFTDTIVSVASPSHFRIGVENSSAQALVCRLICRNPQGYSVSEGHER
jgi:hypothetical protein